MRRVALIALATALAGCGANTAGGGASSGRGVPWVDPKGVPPIVGSMSVNPADATLFMSTNTGLFRIASGASEPVKVVGTLKTASGTGKISGALVASFVGPDELLGSGHPAAGVTLPSSLGLVRSDDAGETWSSVSMLGKADFHAIAISGDTIAAALYGQPQVLLSMNGGKTWSGRAAPQPLASLAVDPGDAARWIAGTERGTFGSADGGHSWRERDVIPNVRFAWPASDRLYQIDPDGRVKVSADGGATWEDRGTTGGRPQAITVDDDGKLYVALLNGAVTVSTDGGRTFTEQVAGG